MNKKKTRRVCKANRHEWSEIVWHSPPRSMRVGKAVRITGVMQAALCRCGASVLDGRISPATEEAVEK